MDQKRNMVRIEGDQIEVYTYLYPKMRDICEVDMEVYLNGYCLLETIGVLFLEVYDAGEQSPTAP